MKKQMNVEMKNFTNVVELYMESAEMNYGVEMEMAKLSERFLGSARLLPKQDFLGWQIVLKKGERIVSHCFSSSEGKVGSEDFQPEFPNHITMISPGVVRLPDLCRSVPVL